jgi:hypothetical protein
MMRLQSFVFAALTAATLIACNKPTDEACRKAIGNMRTLMGTDNLRDNDGIEGEVRRCKGGSSKKSVECAIKATSLNDLRTCDFFKVPDNALGVGTGSAAPVGSAGSAVPTGAGMTGSATGSDATGSAAGSATMTGSAAGSATMTGSAAGSAAGSATAAGSAH